MKKLLLSVLALLTCSFFLLQCGNEDKDDQSAINGTWKITDYNTGAGIKTAPFNDTTASGITYTYNTYYSISNDLIRQYTEVLTSSNQTLLPIKVYFKVTNDDNISKLDSEFIYFTDNTFERYSLGSDTFRRENPSDSTLYINSIKADDAIIVNATAQSPSNNSISKSDLKDCK